MTIIKFQYFKNKYRLQWNIFRRLETTDKYNDIDKTTQIFKETEPVEQRPHSYF